MLKQILISLTIFVFLIIGTALIGIYGRGYEINFRSGKPEVTGTGLLVLTSNPDGAQVYINDKLTTATNNTINLPPGSYNVKISKQGYFDWKKTIIIQKEIVAKADGLLFPVSPKYESITDLGVSQPAIDPTGTRLAYTVASQSARKNNGVYILSMNAAPILTLQGATQIADDTTDTFSTAKLSWSPDGQNIMASTSANTYLLQTNGFNSNPQIINDVAQTVLNTWQTEKDTKQKAQIASLLPTLQAVMMNAFSIISWSPDESKILYQSTAKYKIPAIISPPLIGVNSTPEQRNITTSDIYVYDIKEDRNYFVLSSEFPVNPDLIGVHGSEGELSLRWLPDSKHIMIVQNKQVYIKEFDGSNNVVISGPFADDNDAFPWPDGSKIVIHTNLGNIYSTPNLYTVSLR